MKSKKIIAWILSMAMLITMMPSALVFAADGTAEACPELVVTFFTQDVSQTEGNDLVKNEDDAFDLGLGGMYDPIAKGESDNTWKNADVTAVTVPSTRRQGVTIWASAKNGHNFGLNHDIYDGAVQYAYLNLDKAFLEENEDGTMKEAAGEKWYDYKALEGSSYSLVEFNRSEERLNKVKATNQQVVADSMTTVNIWNILRSDFTGYIRIKVTDSEGYSTYQDSLFVADGKHPSVSVESKTNRTDDGVVTTKPYDTKISGRVYIGGNNGLYEEVDTLENIWYGKTDADMLAEIENDYENKLEYWTNADINLSIVATDENISAELDSLEWKVYNFKNNRSLEEDTSEPIVKGKIILEPYQLGVNDDTKKVINAEDFLPGNSKGYTPQITEDDLRIPATAEGMNVLVVTVEDKAGLKMKRYYYFFVDKTAPKAEFNLVELDENVISLFTAADVVTNRQQAIDMGKSADVKAGTTIISKVEAFVESDANANRMYQYRLLATKVGEAAKDTDGDGENDVPADYTEVVLDKKGNDLSGWKNWTGETETPVIDKEFDGIIQVRVQDRAGNWSPIVSVTSDSKETIITDNTNPLITVKEYALDEDGDVPAQQQDMVTQNGVNILDVTEEAIVVSNGTHENEVIHVLEGAKAPWISDTAVLEVNITDEDLVNEIRSSGLVDGQITVDVDFHDDNEKKEIKIWNKDLTKAPNVVTDTFEVTEDNFFGDNTDKNLTFYIAYEGTGVADVTVSVKDQADVNDGDVYSSIYKVQLKVDKINPYITYKGSDITAIEKDLLKVNNEKVDYEVRNMPWGPNSQILEVVVKDDDITPVQSKTKNVKFNADKKLVLYKLSDGTFTKVKTYAAGNNNIVALSDCQELANDKYESNVGYKFYLVYEGTGTAKVEFFADDSAVESNVRDYPSVATAADAEPVLYDAMLRVDKIAPEFKDVKLVEQTDDVDDVDEFKLFALEGTPVENVTRKQLKLDFDVIDNIGTGAEAGLLQSGVNYKDEIPQIDGADVAITEVKEKYLEFATEYYDNRDIEFVDLLENGTTDEDPRIEYILLPVVDNKMPARVAGSTVLDYIEDNWKEEWITTWNDDIVIDKEFQGAIVLRTIDRVGNIVYSDVIQVVAESKSPLVKFVTEAPTGNKWETLNQYGWAKRDVYFEVKVKDQNEADVDAGIAKVVLEADVDDVMSLEGENLGTVAKEVSVAGLTADADGYISIGYVKATATSTLTVTVYDKAELYDELAASDIAESGNKTVATYNVNIDKTAPEVDDEDVSFTVKDNDIKLNIDVANLYDGESGIAPLWKTAAYNKHNGFMPLYSVSGDGEKNTADQELLGYYFNSYDDVMDYNTIESAQYVREGYVHENEAFEANQWEIPGVQYALIPKNGDVNDVSAWNFEGTTGYTAENGYFEAFATEYKWHNYVPGETVANVDFDGYIVVRVVDKAGNITLLGTSSILDIEFDNDWKNETQFIQVKASEKNGVVTDVEYFGNNDLLFPDGVHRSLTEALSGEGAFIEVVNEGITNVVIKSKTDIGTADPITLSDWEGAMNIGSLNKDWKYQFVDVKIDKHAPEYDFVLKNNDEEIVADADQIVVDAVSGEVKVVIDHIMDPKSNIKRDDKDRPVLDADGNVQPIEGMSHISSGIKSIEWCAVPEGSEEENWKNYYESDTTIKDKAFTGTIKVRVTDKAGNVTEKSKFIRIDSATPIISISKSYDEEYSHEPVDVFVTVSESDEFSDIKSVTYTVVTKDGVPVEDFYHEDDKGNRKNELPLIGGTISIDKTGEYIVTVTAANKAGVSVSKKIDVNVHLEDLTMPFLKDTVSGEWKKLTDNKVAVVADAEDKVRYSKNGSPWTPLADDGNIELSVGENTIRIQAFRDCGCESDVNTYIINYDNGEKPNVSVMFDSDNQHSWKKDFVTVGITANQGASPSKIAGIKAKLQGNYTKDFSFGPYGGDIVIQEEGQWDLEDIIVTMESGLQYIVTAKVEGGRTIFGEVVAYTSQSGDGYKCTVAKIDRTAPVVESDAFELIETGHKAEMYLFGMEDVKSSEKLRLSTDTNKIKDAAVINVGLLKYEYAVLKNGDTAPNWKVFSPVKAEYNAEGELVNELELPLVIEEAFEGSVLLKVTDLAGNETVVSKSVFTEGVAPEISVTAPTGWQTEDFIVDVDVVDKGISSTIKSVTYTINGGVATELTSIGGSIEITEEGTHTIVITAEDYAGNSTSVTKVVKLDKTAPKYSRMIQLLGVYNEHTIPESEWNIIHDGWTYNHDVSLDGIKDIHSGIKKVNIKFTSADGATTETTLNSHQTSSSFSESGKYDLTLIDNAGNVRNISFAINKDLQNVINVIGVDAVGKLNIAVTDGDDMLSFYKKENRESKFTKMYNGITDQLVDGKTGVRYIYGQNDSGKKTNTLYVIVAPSTEYGFSLMGLNATPNRYLNIDTEGGNVTVKKIVEEPTPDSNAYFEVNEEKTFNSAFEINEDGVYSITTND